MFEEKSFFVSLTFVDPWSLLLFCFAVSKPQIRARGYVEGTVVIVCLAWCVGDVYHLSCVVSLFILLF